MIGTLILYECFWKICISSRVDVWFIVSFTSKFKLNVSVWGETAEHFLIFVIFSRVLKVIIKLDVPSRRETAEIREFKRNYLNGWCLR